MLQAYDWPGNIRELKNIVERLMIMVNRSIVLPADVEEVLALTPQSQSVQEIAAVYAEPYQPNTPLSTMVDAAEAACIQQALDEHDWNIRKTAEGLGVERSNLYKKMKKYNIFRPGAKRTEKWG